MFRAAAGGRGAVHGLTYVLPALWAVSAAAAAPDLSVNPVSVTLSRTAAAGQLEMGNSGDAPDLLQSQVFRWTRQHCVDAMVPADSLVVSPPIFSVQPDSSQIVRVLLTGPVSDREEQTLRVVLTEVGIAKPAAGTVAVRFALSLPVFVRPLAPAAPKVEWSLARAGSKIEVTARNTGNAHTRLRALKLIGADGTTLSNDAHTDYLLAGDSCNWSFSVNNLGPGAHVIAVTEERQTTLEVPAS